MKDHIEHLDSILRGAGREVLENAGVISTQRAREKAEIEYRKFQAKTPSPVEKEYLESIKALEITAKKANRTIESQTKREVQEKRQIFGALRFCLVFQIIKKFTIF